MLSLIAFICSVAGYVLFFLTEWVVFPILLMVAGVVVALVDLVTLYTKEKLLFNDFVKEAFRTNWGSMIAVLAAIFFIWLLIQSVKFTKAVRGELKYGI